MFLCTTPNTTWIHVYRCVGLWVRVHVLCTCTSPQEHLSGIVYSVFRRLQASIDYIYLCTTPSPHGHMYLGVLGSGCVYMYSVRVLRLRNTFPVSSIPCSGVYRRLYMYLCTIFNPVQIFESLRTVTQP